MRRVILALLLFSVMVNATLDQTYVHMVSRDGSSIITKTMDLTIFSNVLGEQAFARVDEICRTDVSVNCSVDAESKTITMTESFSEGNYYTFTTDYGLPFITHKLVVRRIPTDRFSSSLDQLLIAAGVVDSSERGSARPLDLRDKEATSENAYYLGMFNANLTYTIEMPAPVSEASAGSVNGAITGNTAQFDLVDVFEESEYMTVTSNELNLGYLAAIAMAVVVIALALSFSGVRRSKRGKKRFKK